MTSTVPASSSTNVMMARRARSPFTTRTKLPHESNAASRCFVPDPPSAVPAAAMDTVPRGGRSSAPAACSPTLRRWMSSWTFSQAADRRWSSGSVPSSKDTSYRRSVRPCISESSSLRLANSFSRLCFKFSSREMPASLLTTRPQDSGESLSPKVTRATLPARAASIRLLIGSNSALMSSCVLWSRRLTALMFIQLISSLPLYSLRNWTAYSSTGSVMYKISKPSRLRPSVYGDFAASRRDLPVM
mmetsp:Transcript_41421/g.128770  ORF Transcript_41421/g.128770 Transcript_41421/m.128770 type:complete len:245 (+) Transcript_41421:970-1704(+)